MTTFVDFVIARGTARITRVRKAKEQYGEDYSPARDFYKRIREAIIDVHYGNQPLSSLDVVANQAGERKVELYKECAAGYKRWHGKKTVRAIPVRSYLWRHSDLEVNVNPELRLSVDGTEYLVKLYFKKGNPSKSLLQAALHLLSLHPVCSDGTTLPAILDVQAGRLKTQQQAPAGLGALLAGDAVAFAAMWKAL